MPGKPVSLSEAIDTGISSALGELFVARPGKVTKFDAEKQTATIKPMVKRTLFDVQSDDRTFEELPEIPNVPVIFPRAGDWAMTLPVALGDTVLLVFCDVSLAEWRTTGEVAEPLDARRHSLGWPVAIPGFFPDSKPLSSSGTDVAARTGGAMLGQQNGASRIELSPTSIKLGKNAIDAVALSTPTQAGLAACMAAANVAIASIGAFIAAYSTHTHLCNAPATPSGPPFGAPPVPPVPGIPGGPVAALLTKAQ